jgi:hypothetical protein
MFIGRKKGRNKKSTEQEESDHKRNKNFLGGFLCCEGFF